jgi:hypothetical protein
LTTGNFVVSESLLAVVELVCFGSAVGGQRFTVIASSSLQLKEGIA